MRYKIYMYNDLLKIKEVMDIYSSAMYIWEYFVKIQLKILSGLVFLIRERTQGFAFWGENNVKMPCWGAKILKQSKFMEDCRRKSLTERKRPLKDLC